MPKSLSRYPFAEGAAPLLTFSKCSLAVVALSFIVGCSSTRLTIPLRAPVEVNLADFDKIAVGDFAGREGATLSAELTKALSASDRFEVLNHATLERMLSANGLTLDLVLGVGNQEQVKEVFGATAFISGEVTTFDYDEEITESESSTLELDADQMGGRMSFKRTYAREGTARMAATLQLVDLRTSKIVMIKDFRAEETWTNRSVNAEPSGIDRSPLFTSCREQMIQALLRMITPPPTKYVQVSFQTDDRIPLLQQGFTQAKTGHWQEAIDLFHRGTESSHSQVVHKAFYNLGLAYLYTDELDTSRSAFEEAYARKPDRKYAKALRRVKALIEDRRRPEVPRTTGGD